MGQLVVIKWMCTARVESRPNNPTPHSPSPSGKELHFDPRPPSAVLGHIVTAVSTGANVRSYVAAASAAPLAAACATSHEQTPTSPSDLRASTVDLGNPRP